MNVEVDVILRVVEIAAILGGGYLVAFRLGAAITTMKESIRAQETAQKQHANEIKDLKLEVKKMNEILTQIALQEQRLALLEKSLDELRHGEGFIFPLNFSQGPGGAPPKLGPHGPHGAA